MYVIRKLINPIEYVQKFGKSELAEWAVWFNLRGYAHEYGDYEEALKDVNKIWTYWQICCAIEYANQNDSRG